MSQAIMLGIGIVGGLIIYLYNSMEKEHWLFKIFLLMSLPIVFIMMGGLSAIISSGEAYANIGEGFLKFTTGFIVIFYTYLFGALIYAVFKSFKTRQSK